MRTEAIAALVGRLERQRDEAMAQVRYIDRKWYEDRENLYREFDLRTRQLQAMNDYLLGLLSKQAALDMAPVFIVKQEAISTASTPPATAPTPTSQASSPSDAKQPQGPSRG